MQQSIPIFDGHNDTLLNLYEKNRGKGRSFFVESDIGHIDLPRARKGNFIGGFFAIFVPTPGVAEPPEDASDKDLVSQFLESRMTPVDHQHALAETLAMARLMFDLESEAAGQVKVVTNAEELGKCIDAGVLAMIFHIEGAEAIDEGLDALYVLYEAGLRSVGIVWSRPNAFGNGVPFSFPGSPDTGEGLTAAGRDLVRTCNELGIMLDLSHLNEKGFWEVAALSDRPLVATHSSVHAICPSPRNLTDEQMIAIRDSGGVMGINFHVGFLREDGEQDDDMPLNDLVHHIDYAVNLIGADHVVLGSDFDGALMPKEWGDVTGLPEIVDLLRGKGYTDGEISKIGYENWLRVLNATWR